MSSSDLVCAAIHKIYLEHNCVFTGAAKDKGMGMRTAARTILECESLTAECFNDSAYLVTDNQLTDNRIIFLRVRLNKGQPVEVFGIDEQNFECHRIFRFEDQFAEDLSEIEF